MGAGQDDVAKFLKEFKDEIVSGRGLDVVWRAVNRSGLRELGLTNRNRQDAILALTVTHYSAGPDPDHDRAGEMWIFGKRIAGREVYIKLKLAYVDGTRIAKCISFHRAEYPLTYPFD